jgi:hypothetical protein
MMLDKFIKAISKKQQGSLALIMGLILILGSLGKLGILQGILNAVMISVGLILLVWGLIQNDVFNQIKRALKK